MHDRPLIVQSDRTMLLDVHSPAADECRDAIVSFSELVKSPEHLHTFAISNITIWNACSAGVSLDFIMESLDRYSRFEIPEVVKYYIEDNYSRFGAICFEEYDDDRFLLTCSKDIYRTQLLSIKSLLPYLEDRLDDDFIIPMAKRGELKLKLIYSNFPVNDLIPLKKGLPLDISLRKETLSGKKFGMRNYQKDSLKAFYADGARGAGYGTIVLPCGSGKTIVGLAAMATLRTSTLILAPNVASVHQWIREILDKTTIREEDVGEYGSTVKEIKPVTVCTYSMLINHSNEEQEMKNFRLKNDITFDWLKWIIRENAPTWKADLSISGRTEKLDYYISLGTFDQQGNEYYSYLTRYNLRSNMNVKVTDWLKMGTNITLSYQQQSEAGYSTTSTGYYNPMNIASPSLTRY